jgi:hypothetical protein
MKTGLTRALPVLAACALACTLPGSTAARVAVTLTGTVGPGFTITLTNPNGSTVTSLPPGTYTIHVDDNSGIHNFHPLLLARRPARLREGLHDRPVHRVEDGHAHARGRCLQVLLPAHESTMFGQFTVT